VWGWNSGFANCSTGSARLSGRTSFPRIDRIDRLIAMLLAHEGEIVEALFQDFGGLSHLEQTLLMNEGISGSRSRQALVTAKSLCRGSLVQFDQIHVGQSHARTLQRAQSAATSQ
jgi:hypothetical protein